MFDNMFSNIGTKIKSITKSFCLIGMGLSIVGGVLCIISGLVIGEGSLVWSGLLIGLGCAVACWLSSLTLYGFGELIENSCIQTELLLRMEKRNRE
ncbi:MAG: hypothetical protein J6K32_08595 [Clostridia bacterium]|nr:hypothetical protein [Clostridia bacterium]